jgi:riboflavin biosynthesis pyrimidine reductase
MQTLLDLSRGATLPLPANLAALYGSLRFPAPPGRAYVVANFATTLDGVVSLNRPGHSSGGEITGFEPHDRMVMGILRAAADAVVVGAGTFRAVPRHIWTADHVDPGRSAAFAAFRRRLGKPAVPLNVVVTSTGNLDLRRPLFSSGEVPVLIVTTASGARRLPKTPRGPNVQVEVVRPGGRLTAASVMAAVGTRVRFARILVEGGPHLLGDFLAEGQLDELFLTLAPQIAGRSNVLERLGLVAGQELAPARPCWGTLTGVRRAENFLFLRFGIDRRLRAQRGGRTR